MTELKLNFKYEFDPQASVYHFIDLAQCMSLVNRKMYRQGMQYVVADIELITDADDSGRLDIYALPNVWPVINGYNKAYSVWQKSQWQVLDNETDIAGKYRDFKVFYNHTHYLQGTDGKAYDNLLPLGFTRADMALLPNFATDADYDWDMSEIVLPNEGGTGVAESFCITAIGDDHDVGVTGSRSAAYGYALGRARPQLNDPNVMTGPVSWMTDAFDVGENLPDIRDDLVYHNDTPPYPVYNGGTEEAYPYGPNWPGSGQNVNGTKQDTLVTRAGTALAMDNTGPLMFNCGLIQIINVGATAFDLKITLAPGNYNDCMARPMKEAN